MGTLRGFPNPPAKVRGERSSPAPHATEMGTLRGFALPFGPPHATDSPLASLGLAKPWRSGSGGQRGRARGVRGGQGGPSGSPRRGSPPSPTRGPSHLRSARISSSTKHTRRGGREAEGGGLLNRYTGENLYREFESHPLRQTKAVFAMRHKAANATSRSRAWPQPAPPGAKTVVPPGPGGCRRCSCPGCARLLGRRGSPWSSRPR